MTIMHEAARLTRAGRLTEAARMLQSALGGRGAVPGPATTAPGPALDMIPPGEGRTSWTAAPGGADAGTSASGTYAASLLGRLAQALPKAVPGAGRRAGPVAAAPAGALFEERVHAGPAGSRAYKLYVPAAAPGGPMPLVVMLHGCTQSPDDFAAGTRMNALAEELGFAVAYPAQTKAANASRCWNWFSAADQRRESGEPAIVAGIVRDLLRDLRLDPRRVFVAGLSAGGAAASVLGMLYPDLFAAIGVHSGLACGAARDMGGAFAAMKGGGTGLPRADGPGVRTIVFHGDRDGTVNPVNGDQVVAQFAGPQAGRAEVARGTAPGGGAWTRTRQVDAQGRAASEHWVVHGAGHAWSGGSPDGTYTDPRGPDASREMLRFFLEP